MVYHQVRALHTTIDIILVDELPELELDVCEG